MLSVSRTALVLVLMSVTACAGGVSRPDPMARKVAKLVNATTKQNTESAALAGLQTLGSDAVPYLVQHLGDLRPLPDPTLELGNGPGSFEGVAHYGPKVVHDALSAILNRMTGKFFEDVYSGASDDIRAKDKAEWTAWCVATYRAHAAICQGQGAP